MTSPALATLAGLAFGLSLIVAIGAQNAFVLRQGLRREHVLAVVLVCALSDAVLIGAGVLGLGALLSLAPWLDTVMRLAGAAFLLGYGLRAAYRAWRPQDGGGLESGTAPAASRGRSPLWAAVGTCLALTWLNPHVYLDTVVLLGSVAGSYGDLRWWFGAGAAAGSILWFAALGYGARFLRPLFARPLSWRILDGVIAVIMIAIAASLVVGAL